MTAGSDRNRLWHQALGTVGDAARLARRIDTPRDEWEDLFRALVPIWAMPTEASKVVDALYHVMLTPSEAIAVCVAYRFCEGLPIAAEEARRISFEVAKELSADEPRRLELALNAIPKRSKIVMHRGGGATVVWAAPELGGGIVGEVITGKVAPWDSPFPPPPTADDVATGTISADQINKGPLSATVTFAPAPEHGQYIGLQPTTPDGGVIEGAKVTSVELPFRRIPPERAGSGA
jgi:hypothetical protein